MIRFKNGGLLNLDRGQLNLGKIYINMIQRRCTAKGMSTLITATQQTWGELIVNANALIMHSFFSVILGNY